MKCPKCQHENPEGAKFCNECANKLEILCPQCGKANPPSSKFCNECAHNLTIPSPEPSSKALSFDEKIDKIQRYLPKGLTEKILAQRDKIEGERKQVTVMFCDMEGFTALVDKVGPEETYAIMDEVYEILIHKVHNYEGTVNEMTGDGIMALFGAPIALEDAPQRAIRSSLAVHREMAKFSDRLKRETEGILPLKMRIGIHSGPVVVGTLGNDLRVEFKAVGDTVNLASRMEGLAEPASTYVTEETFKYTEGFFRFEALGEKRVKGKEEPIKVYRVLAPSTRRTRFDVSAERGLTPFVGRGRELEIILDAFDRAKARRGQAISIISEAGAGKSRLLYEFRKVVANEDATFLEGKCLSYSRGVAYHPVTDILKSNFNVQEGEADSDIRKKVRNGLKVLGADESTTLPYLLELLSVKDSGIDKIMMSPEGKKDRVIEALKRIVLKGSEVRPLVLALEDLHWIDKTSEEILKFILESIPGSKVLLIFTYRPDFVHPWGPKSYHSQLTLNRLSNRETLAMVNYLLGTEDLDTNLEQLILEKTEGVPFFIEEFIRSVVDLGIIEREASKYRLAKDTAQVTIPSTIQDVIMARVDSVPEGAKAVLQAGSVIEREFSYEMIKQVTGLSEQELISHLSALKDSELIYERGIYPETSYVFKHALTREVVYDSILTKTKKELHAEIGSALEALYKQNISEYYGVLAEHFIESENYEKGAEYSRLAGKKAEKTGSLNDAIAFAKKRVACLERMPQKKDTQNVMIDARIILGLYIAQMNYMLEAKEATEPIIDLALEYGSERRLCQIYTITGAYNYWIEENFPKAFEDLEKALMISEKVGDVVSLVLANYWLGCGLSINCEFEKASSHIEKALNINVAANNLWGISAMKSSLCLHPYYFTGKLNLCHQLSNEAIQIAEESGDIYSKALAYTSHGLSCYGRGFLEEAIEYLLKGVDFCERINQSMWNSIARFFLGDTFFEMGEYSKSKDHFGKGSWILEQIKTFPSLVNLGKIGVARAKAVNHERDIDLETLYGFVNLNNARLYEGWMARYIGEILLSMSNQHMTKAEKWIKKAVETNRRNGVIFHLGKDYVLYGEFYKRKGDETKAKENLNKAIKIFKECGAGGWVEKAKKELHSLS